jgi:uncharacterized MnhB-related membrane protein
VFSANNLNGFLTEINFDFVNLILGAVAFIIIRKTKINSVLMIPITGVVGGLIYYLLALV